jgi:hypothetical protein
MVYYAAEYVLAFGMIADIVERVAVVPVAAAADVVAVAAAAVVVADAAAAVVVAVVAAAGAESTPADGFAGVVTVTAMTAT